MTEEINPSELGAFTNNLSNKEGIKKLINAVEDNTSAIATKQDKLTAGSNVAISDQNVISATDTKYTAGDNIAISDQNVISATDTTYTAGTGISISEQNVISATGGDDWIECTNFVTDFDTYKDTHEFLVYSEYNVLGTFRKNELNAGDYMYISPIEDLLYNSSPAEPKKYGAQRSGSTLKFYRLPYFKITEPVGATIKIKGYDIQTDAEIDSTNISNYIDSTDNYKCIKSFICALMRDDKIESSFVCVKGMNNTQSVLINIGTLNDNISLSMSRISMAFIYGAINNGNSVSIAPNCAKSESRSSLTVTKMYRRKLDFTVPTS